MIIKKFDIFINETLRSDAILDKIKLLGGYNNLPKEDKDFMEMLGKGLVSDYHVEDETPNEEEEVGFDKLGGLTIGGLTPTEYYAKQRKTSVGRPSERKPVPQTKLKMYRDSKKEVSGEVRHFYLWDNGHIIIYKTNTGKKNGSLFKVPKQFLKMTMEQFFDHLDKEHKFSYDLSKKAVDALKELEEIKHSKDPKDMERTAELYQYFCYSVK